LQTAAKYAQYAANQGSGGRSFAATLAIAQVVSVPSGFGSKWFRKQVVSEPSGLGTMSFRTTRVEERI
jgi:hypothetical protein